VAEKACHRGDLKVKSEAGIAKGKLSAACVSDWSVCPFWPGYHPVPSSELFPLETAMGNLEFGV
jgi:hypothetical protein